jgi:hypothetical protein
MAENTYEDGLIAGEIKAHTQTLEKHEERLDSHSRRVRALERVAWALLGIVGFIEIWPRLETFFGG